MFRSVQNVVPSHLLDHQQFDFKSINRESGIIDGGDIGFDAPELENPPSQASLASVVQVVEL
jgi:tRNA 2-thiocytidine biosynthesis protein TtcA